MPSVSQQYFSLSVTIELFGIAVALSGSHEGALFVGSIGLVVGIVGFIFPPHDKDKAK